MLTTENLPVLQAALGFRPDGATCNMSFGTATLRGLEQQIRQAQAVIDGAPARKQAILKKYL